MLNWLIHLMTAGMDFLYCHLPYVAAVMMTKLLITVTTEYLVVLAAVRLLSLVEIVSTHRGAVLLCSGKAG